jgi:hypothetical protein
MILPAWATKPTFAAIIYGANIILFVIALAAVGAHLGDVTNFLLKLPAPIATTIVGIAGFGGIAWQAKIGFANLVKAQEHRAAIESKGRLEQASIQRDLVDQDRSYNQRIVAASLHGELIALLSRVHGSRSLLFTQWKIFEAASQDRLLKDVLAPLNAIPTYSVPVFESCIPKLGLLGPSIVGDVVEVFSKATNKPSNAEPVQLKPEIIAKLYKAVYESHLDWSNEIVHVGGRLAALQGAGPDPGTLYEMRQAKDAEKKTLAGS